MDENVELLEYVYQSAEMGVSTLTKLINEINEKGNKIKKRVEEEIKEYESFLKDATKLIKKKQADVKPNSMMKKMGANMGVKKETNKDNSDSAIARMLTEGLTMGIVDITAKIKNYKKSVEKDVLKLANNYLDFSNKEVEALKEYL